MTIEELVKVCQQCQLMRRPICKQGTLRHRSCARWLAHHLARWICRICVSIMLHTAESCHLQQATLGKPLIGH